MDNKNEMKEMPMVPVSQVRKLSQSVDHMRGSEKISLEYVLTALFPTVWNNIQKYGNDCYTQGYIQGKNEK